MKKAYDYLEEIESVEFMESDDIFHRNSAVEELIKKVVEANPKTILVMVAGAPFDIKDISTKTNALVWSWFNGSEGGNALADVILGNVNPSGKLPWTMPVDIKDSPAHATNSFPGDKTVEYTECVYLDQGYNSLYVNYERPTQNMNTMSVKDVDYNFYQAILDYEKEHRKELLTKIIDQVKPEDLKAAGITLTKEQKKNMKENKKQRR